MSSRKGNSILTKFYQEDVVQRVNDSKSRGIVLRCWHDSDVLQHINPVVDALLRPLERGEVGVSFLPGNSREILPESEFVLVDRPMQIGDIVKRRTEDVESAVVTGVTVRFKVAHAVSGRKLDEWKTLSDIKALEGISVGDYVAYDDWVGQIQDMFDESTVETGDGTLMRLPEVSARLSSGDRGDDILPSPPEQGLSGLLSYFLGDVRPSPNDVVVSVKHTVFAVSWMAINQMLSVEEASGRQRPQRFWFGPDISKLTLLHGFSDLNVRIGDKLYLKSPPEDYLTRHGQEGGDEGIITVETFVVDETETSVEILWQNGSREALPSTQLTPYLNPDEYDCWPGDHVVWKTEETSCTAVVQSVNAVERTADILLEDGRREVVSVLELDPHGTDAGESNPQDGFGVRRGDFVFIHREGTTNGHEKPIVPGIGELEAWAHDPPSVEANGEYTGWRKELDDLGQKIARTQGSDRTPEGVVQRPPLQTDIDWLGEVVDLGLNGLIKIALMNSETREVPLERLSRLSDGHEQLEDLWGDDLSDGHDGYYEDDSDKELEILTEEGEWQAYSGDDDDEWVEEEDLPMSIEEAEISLGPEDILIVDPELHPDGFVPGAWPMSTEETEHIISVSTTNETISDPVSLPSTHDDTQPQSSTLGEPSWKRFDILPSAPPDHAFYSTPPCQPSRQFMSRLSKEYRALESSLPESVIIRTYEDRVDLLRSLIIGPENTPYEDAPFVIDWMLDSNFPQTPPVAHFLSWTNGNGRVNPNLYEEGKVCLSILGTWSGDKSESWSPTRSSLLQALVSIQGLVLVKEPWYCEPAYEKWRGTEEGRVNSRLYNEKAYVLSRAFVRRALEISLGSVDDVIRDIYLTQGKLKKVIQSAQALIEKSKITADDDNDDERAVHRLTGGGIITLTRTLDKLEAILAKESPPL